MVHLDLPSRSTKKLLKRLSEIDDNSTIIITTGITYGKNFLLKRNKEKEYTLTINKKTKSISCLFYNNHKISKFIFDNWDTSNIEKAPLAFSGLSLDESPDFSNLNFSNLNDAEEMFDNSIIKGDFIFKNHTLKNLFTINSAFSHMTCKNMLIDLGKTNIIHLNYLFERTTAKSLTVKIDETCSNSSALNLLCKSKIDLINLKDFNMSNIIFIENMLHFTVSNKIIIPDILSSAQKLAYWAKMKKPLNTITEEKILSSNLSNIKTVYCNEEWAKLFETK